jgi:hypothetical protein
MMDADTIKEIGVVLVVFSLGIAAVVRASINSRRARMQPEVVPYQVNGLCFHCGKSEGRGCEDKLRADSECFHCHTPAWISWEDLEAETAQAKDLASRMGVSVQDLKVRLRNLQVSMGLIINGERVQSIEPNQFTRGRLVHRT